jgi:hypothetical protein
VISGQKVFEELLLDADWSLNAGNWMWLSASAFFHQVRPNLSNNISFFHQVKTNLSNNIDLIFFLSSGKDESLLQY